MLTLLLACSAGLDAYDQEKSTQVGHDSGTDSDGSPIDSATDADQAPVADAGPDQEVAVGDVVELDGEGSYDPDGDALDYAWEITDRPSGSAAALINATFPDPQFIPDLAGAYDVTLVVSDGALDSAPDVVRITAADVNGRPLADAGPDQAVYVPTTVYLDGTGSTDADGDPLVYAWTLVSRPGGSAAALSSSSSATPSFYADVTGTYEVSLTVFDGEDYSSADNVRITGQTYDTGGTTSGGCGCGGGGGAWTLSMAAALLVRRHRPGRPPRPR